MFLEEYNIGKIGFRCVFDNGRSYFYLVDLKLNVKGYMKIEYGDYYFY